MEEFNIGDIVELKSGGPKMTIEKFGLSHPPLAFFGQGKEPEADKSEVHCRWWDRKKEQFEYAVFQSSSLKMSTN